MATGNWWDILSGATSVNNPQQGGMDIFNPGSSTSFLMPYGASSPAGATAMQGFTPMSSGMSFNSLPNATGGSGAMTSFGTPWMNNWSQNVNQGLGGLGAPGSIPGSVTKGNVAYSGVSPEEGLLDRMFRGSATGKGGGPIAQQLFQLGMGNIPGPLAEQIVGSTNEQFGKMGARFGTDLGTAISRGLGQAGAATSLDAIKQILGLGGTTAGFQFQRGESGLDRSLQDLLSQRQTDLMSALLPALLGGLGG